MANSRYAPVPVNGKGRGFAARKGSIEWTMQRAKEFLARNAEDETFMKRDSAYHWLLDRIENRVATGNEIQATKALFRAARERGDLDERHSVRKRYTQVFSAS